MPNTTIYMDNETYTGFINLSEDKQKELREQFVKKVKKEVNQNV